MDFIPVGTLIGGNIIKAQIASDVFHSSIKIGGLAIYTLYVALRKPLNETLKNLTKNTPKNILPKITAFDFADGQPSVFHGNNNTPLENGIKKGTLNSVPFALLKIIVSSGRQDTCPARNMQP